MKKKVLSVLLCGALAVGAFAGCGKEAAEEGVSKEDTPAAEEGEKSSQYFPSGHV